MRSIGVVTVGRSDYDIYRPVLDAIRRDPELRLVLLVTGTHLSPDFGHTVRVIEADGFTVDEAIEMLVSSDTPAGVAKSIGLGVLGFADVFRRVRPDLLIVLGDRFEMFAAAVAATPFAIPIAHIHGGESTEGTVDEAFRHALTKMSHLHFVATETYHRRVLQLGEERWRVTVSGAPALDAVRSLPPLDRDALEARLQLPLDPPPLLVTFHPSTLEPGEASAQIEALLAALDSAGHPVVFTAPNADAENRTILSAIQAFVAARAQTRLLANLGWPWYCWLMASVLAMVGNSSSGIIEAASFGLPVVNIGSRQRGRVHGANVVDVPCEREAIEGAINLVGSPDFRQRAARVANPYGDGHAAARIVDVLRNVALNRALVVKRFVDLEVSVS